MYCTSTGYQYFCGIGVWSCPCVTAHPFFVLILQTIYQWKALGLSIPTVYGTSSGELIQTGFAAWKSCSQYTIHSIEIGKSPAPSGGP